MAKSEVTGATVQELAEMEFQHNNARLHTRHGIPFETAFCLTPIGNQPEDYDGPDRYCKQRAGKLTDEEWAERYEDEYDSHDTRAYHPKCRFHGRSCNGQNSDNLQRPGFANLRHGMYAENFRLAEDFSEADSLLFEYILGWADIYGWPPQEEDPARYDLLEQFAYDRVRSVRSSEWFEGVAEDNDGQSQVEYRTQYDEQGIEVGEIPVPNTLSEDIRLLRKDIRDQMKELGLTPKSRGEMEATESATSAYDAVGDLAEKALGGEHSFDPDSFEEPEPEEGAEEDTNDNDK